MNDKKSSSSLISWVQDIKNLEKSGLPEIFWEKVKSNKLNQIKFEIFNTNVNFIKDANINPVKFKKIKELQSIDENTLIGFFESKGSIKQIKI